MLAKYHIPDTSRIVMGALIPFTVCILAGCDLPKCPGFGSGVIILPGVPGSGHPVVTIQALFLDSLRSPCFHFSWCFYFIVLQQVFLEQLALNLFTEDHIIVFL